jgi:hypothetical protein
MNVNEIAKLWEKHAHPDRHGYKDWMHAQGFQAAIEEAFAPQWVPLSTRFPPKGKVLWVACTSPYSGKRVVKQALYNPGLKRWTANVAIIQPTHFMEINPPELPR